MKRRALLAGASLLAAPRALAQPMPVYSPVGLRPGGPGPLWPVGSSPLGASLDLSFTTPGTLDPRITFTRGSTATYFDATGTLQTVSGNTPRWDYNPSTLALNGLLIEEARTNNWIWSSFASVWNPIGSGAVAPTVADNQTTSPDGTADASRVVYPTVSAAGNYSVLYNAFTVTATPYSFSVYLKGSVGGERIYIMASNAGTYYRTQATLTTAWQRFVLSTPALTAASWQFEIGTDLRDASQTATSAQTIYAWGAQLEQGAFATSYIPTGGATVTRSADVATMPLGTWFVSSAFTFVPEAALPVAGPANSFQVVAEFSDGTANNRDMLWRTSAGNGFLATSTIAGTNVYNQTIGTLTPGVTFKAAMTTIAGQQTSAFNSVLGPTGTAAQVAGLSQLLLGSSVQGLQINGYIRRFRYWPRVLTNTELQQVTT